MSVLSQTFRRVAAQACAGRNLFREFMAAGLEDILEEADANNWSASEIVVQVLARCCVEDGRFNNQQARILAVITFLNERYGRLQGERQAFIDLLAVLNSGGSVGAIRGWMSATYP